MKKCVIFCAGQLSGPVDAADAYVICADGGLRHAQVLGLTPDIILGDFDSLGFTPTGAQVFPVEKDDTDAMLAVRHALDRGFRELHIYAGLEGDRLDHTVANFQTLCYIASHGARGYLYGKDTLVTVLTGETARFSPEAEGILSLFCLGPDARVTIRGLQYPLENGLLCHDFPLGVSNHFVGKSSEITVHNGKVLMIWGRNNGLPDRKEAAP